ncbi:threonine/homoserine efflux transporter RhtA [Orbus hercynius]|uniref:Threonine/homoserine efflux transporter RhtA n=1 Tax=Orbus hercynius TaxID=593135 RepID=A0A495RJM8_9GAMM|nr:DMT family transporter [Orbus hercynius]RKS87500.1 threonine/homoserine efflux transporter RhtA [Orbus hercynius]
MLSTSSTLKSQLLLLLILVTPPFLWAANFIVGRAVNGIIPPITLSFARWIIATLIILPFAISALKKDARRYYQYRWKILFISILGAAAFNSLTYVGLQYTTATNGLLINSFCPMLIVLLGVIFYRHDLPLLRLCGLILSFIGVVIIVLKGNFDNLLTLNFAKGDIIIFIAVVCWAVYTLLLKTLPNDIDKIGLTALQFILATIIISPFFINEFVHNQRLTWSLFSASAIVYVGIFPSVVAFLLYTLAVVKIGAAKTGLFLHLMPVFGALLAFVFLDERLFSYHFIGIVCIFCGITLSSYQKKS